MTNGSLFFYEMNTRKFILFVFLMLITSQTFAQSDDLILWVESKRLTWHDFTEVPPNPEYAARSSISIRYTVCKRSIWNGKVTLRVDCTFQKSNSFVSKADMQPLLLRHEQLHFDIAEVFARKLRKEFSINNLHVGNVDEEAKKLFNQVMVEYMNFQRMFDIETQHGIEKNTQLKWEQKVEEELMRLESHKDSNC